MSTVRIIALSIVLIVLSLIYSAANALSVRTHKMGLQIHKVELLGIEDNKNGTGTVYLDVCGTGVDITATQEELELHPDKVDEAVLKSMDNFCPKDMK